MNKRIPLIILQKELKSPLSDRLNALNKVQVLKVQRLEKYAQIRAPKNAVPDFLIVINSDELVAFDVVIPALLLRNLGHQVFISSNSDFEDLLQVLDDVYKYMVSQEDKTSPCRTEVLVTDLTNQRFGDISPIVRHFEVKFLSPPRSKN